MTDCDRFAAMASRNLGTLVLLDSDHHVRAREAAILFIDRGEVPARLQMRGLCHLAPVAKQIVGVEDFQRPRDTL